MTRHVIKIDASSFKDIRAGRQTCLIHRNDRLWNPGDEIWFAECDGDPLILTLMAARTAIPRADNSPDR